MDAKRPLLWIGALLGAGLCFSPATAVAQRVERVDVGPPDATVQVGAKVSFLATPYDRAGNPLNLTVTWTSSNTHIATIDQLGNATGVNPGTATITAHVGTGHNAKTGRATLLVTSPEATLQPQAVAPPPVTSRPSAPSRGAPAASCAAADREPPGVGPAAGLSLEPVKVSLVKGESQQLTYRPVQANGDPAEHVCPAFSVQTGGEKAATVDSLGLILASSSDTGHAVVQVTVPTKGWIARLVSVEVRADSVRFRSREVSMVPLQVDTLQLTVPAQGNRPVNTYGLFQFASSDPTKVRVQLLAPIVTAVAAGTARITAQNAFYPEIVATISVHHPVASLSSTPADTLITLAIQATTTLGARALAADSSVVSEVPLRWTVGDTTVVHFDTTTKTVRGLKMGETQVVVAVVGDSAKTRRWHFRVIAGGLAITHPGAKAALGVGERMPIEVKLLDDRRQPIETASRLTWTSTNDTVARVMPDGQITALGMGRAHLTAHAPWDSTVATDVIVVGDLLVYALRGGRWDIYMLEHAPSGPRVRQMTQDSLIKSSAPVWSPTLMQIAYVASPGVNGTPDLYLEDADGTGARRLTHDSATVAAPSFVGPNGDQIVFESSKTGKAQLYVMKLDGTGRRQITTGDNPNTQPSVSPDGRRVLYTSVRDKNYDIYEIGLDGTPERRLTNSQRPEDSPQYAADGRSFYYLRDEGGNPNTKRVYRQDLPPASVAPGAAAAPPAQGTPVTPVGLYVRRFSVSPDPSMLVLEILTQDANGVQTTVVTFNVATGARTPVVLSGADKIGGPVFRPATPQH